MTKEINKQEKTKRRSGLKTNVRRAKFPIASSLMMLLAIILLAACGAQNSAVSSANNNAKPDSASSPATRPAVGDTVVAKYKTGSFAEGKIQSIDGQKAKIDWSNKELESIDVDLVNLYPMPKAGAPANVKTGDFVLANTSSYQDGYWNKVQVANVGGGVITVRETNDYSHDVAADKVIAVSPVESADIRAMFDTNGKKSDFDEKARKARPVVPADYKPKVGDKVVAEGQLAWNTGKVKSISGDKATILWDEKNNGTFETTLDKIVPYPAAAGAVMPAVNDFVLIKSGYMEVWDYAQVAGVNGTDVEVKNNSGKTSTVKPGEFIPLK